MMTTSATKPVMIERVDFSNGPVYYLGHPRTGNVYRDKKTMKAHKAATLEEARALAKALDMVIVEEITL